MRLKNLSGKFFWLQGMLVLALGITFLGFMMPSGGISAQGNFTPTPPVGTKIPPTLVPAPAATATPDAPQSSGIANVQTTKKIRVGTVYNAPPFSWLDETGTVTGYEPEVVRAVAVDLGVEVEFIQVTSETAHAMLMAGEIDMLIGQLIHSKDAEQFIEFSHTYFYNRQKMVVRGDAPYNRLAEMGNQKVGVVAGSPAESALNLWMAENSIAFQVTRYLTDAEALDALARGEIEGMAGEFDDLKRAGRQGLRFIEDAIALDPYAIGMRRYDINLRNAVNRALERLTASGRMDEIAEHWFDEEEIAQGAYYQAILPVYQDFAADTRTIDEFGNEIKPPTNSIIAKIKRGESLNVAGLSMTSTDPSYAQFMDNLNREIINEMARRWGVTVVFLPDSDGLGQDMIVQEQADLAIGVEPRWDGVDRVEYSNPYHFHSDKIIVLEGSRYSVFSDLRGGQAIAYFADDPADGERLEELKEVFNTNPGIYAMRDNSDAYDQLFGTRNMHALFGDSIRLQAFMNDNDRSLWRYLKDNRGNEFSDGFEPLVLAVPRGDSDFLSLVNWTLGDMYADGTLQRIWQENYLGNEPPPFIPDYPGVGQFLYDDIAQE